MPGFAEANADEGMSPEDRELLDRMLVDLEPPPDYTQRVRSGGAREGLRSDLRALIGHVCAQDSPVHKDTGLEDDRLFSRVLRAAGGAIRREPGLRAEVEALILGARSVDADITPCATPGPEGLGGQAPAPLHAPGRQVSLKPSGGPLYPALSSQPLSLPGTSHGGGEYLSALMPCPSDPDVATAESWLRGLAWHSGVVNIMLDDPDADLIDDILELETEMDHQMEEILKRPGLRPAQDPDARPDEREWLLSASGAAENPDPKVSRDFEKIVLQLMSRHQPAEYGLIHAMSPGLSLGDSVPAMLAAARETASRWIESEGFIEPDHPHNPMGTISGHDHLTGDTVLERAAFIHMYSGESIAGALFDSLLELRMAQVDRALEGDTPLLHIDRLKSILIDTLDAPLDRYTMARTDYEPEM